MNNLQTFPGCQAGKLPPSSAAVKSIRRLPPPLGAAIGLGMSYDLKTIAAATALVGIFAIAPVAPEAGNALFIGSAVLGLVFMWRDCAAELRRAYAWMPLLGLVLVGVAYGAAAGVEGLVGLTYFAPLLSILPLVCLLRSWPRPEFAFTVGVLALSGAFGAAIMAIYEVQTTGTTRAGEFVANPIHFADVAILVSFCSVLGLAGTPARSRYIFLLGPGAAAISVVLSGTRGALVALAAILVVALVSVLWLRLLSRRSLIALVVVLGVLGSVGLAIGGAQLSAVQRVLSDLSDIALVGIPTDASTSVRLQMYLGGWRAFLQSPLIGHGPLAFTAVADGLADLSFGGAPHLHSDLVDMAASAGALGILAYVLFLAAPLVEAARTRDLDTKPWIIVFAAMLVTGFFVMGLTNAMFGILTVTNAFAAVCVVIGVLTSPALKDERRQGSKSAFNHESE